MTIDRVIYGKSSKPVGKAPSIVLCNVKFPHNVGAAIRAASCYGIEQVWFTGNRIEEFLEGKKRLPREERMKGYKDVELINYDYPFDAFPKGAVPVAVELRENSQPLHTFDHPKNAVYVFGPEDGSIPQVVLRECHHFVIIPTRHCLNLAASVNTILYDRVLKRWIADGEEPPSLAEDRGFVCDLERDYE